MKRRLLSLAVVAVLLAAVVVCEVQLRQLPRQDPLGRRLLYLPTAEALGLISLGNEGLMADVLYLWCIQYYSDFSPNEQFLYLEKVLGLVTDLDPLYFDAYAIGGMIMGMAIGRRPELVQSLVDLYDKGVENMPDEWALAEVAAWDFYSVVKDPEQAVRFATIGASRPGAPGRLTRLAGRWSDKAHLWTHQESIEYWQQAAAEASNDRERSYCLSHLYDVYVEIDRQRLEPMLQTWQAIHRSCPESFEPLISQGLLASTPLDFSDNPYAIDPLSCTLQPIKRIRLDS